MDRYTLSGIAFKTVGVGSVGTFCAIGLFMMHAASDIFLGVTENPKANRHFYVHQLKNRHLGSIGEVIEGKALDAYLSLCDACPGPCARRRPCPARRLYGKIGSARRRAWYICDGRCRANEA